MNKYLFLILAIELCSCGELTEQYYHINSQNDERVLTIVRIKRWLEPAEIQNKLKSGIYLFNGYIEDKDQLPTEYLKLQYSDFSPIGIIWDDTISIGYNYIEKNTFDNNNIKVFEDIDSPEFVIIESNYKTKSNNGKTAYDLDEIFSKNKKY